MAAESPGTEFHAVDTGAYRCVCGCGCGCGSGAYPGGVRMNPPFSLLYVKCITRGLGLCA